MLDEGLMRIHLVSRLAPLVLAVAGTPAFAQVPDAGPDQVVNFPAPAQLAGLVRGGTPLDYWTADGNGITENHLIGYSSVSGLVAVGPLRTMGGTI
jgi:hypothetical protein